MPSLFVSATQTALELATQFAPVPGLYPCVELFFGIIQLVENVQVNRNGVKQLCGRCQLLLKAVGDTSETTPPSQMYPALQQLEDVLNSIKRRMEEWSQLGRVKSFLKQNDIAASIERAHETIDKLIESLHIGAYMETHAWQAEFQHNREVDHNEVVKYLADIQNLTTIVAEVQQEQLEKLDQQNRMMQDMMKLMQDKLSTVPQRDQRHLGIQRNLHHLQIKSGGLLPNLELRAGEVRRIGRNAVGGSAAMDIWEGIYLDEEKVAIKVIRAVHTSERNVIRFRREMEVWSKLWDVDRGQHILPFYGWCQTDGPYPYVVSPWQENGTAIDYVKKAQWVNYKQLILGVAQGVQVLHTMTPPIVHGELKGEHIQVSATGNPLLSDFGLSKMVEDMSGAPFTQSKGVSESCRWLAPELLMGENATMTTSSDIWSLGMTILELLTGCHPFNHIKSNTAVVIKVYGGALPEPPNTPEIVRRGMNSQLWSLLQRCWNSTPEERPAIQEVIAELNSWAQGQP